MARQGTKLEFDLKDYPVLFFKNLKELKDAVERRINGLQDSLRVALQNVRAFARDAE